MSRGQQITGGRRALVGIAVASVAVQFLALTVLRSPGPAGVPTYVDWLPLSLQNVFSGRLWTLLSYSLVHDVNAPTHLLFNLIALFFLAPPLERRWGFGAFMHLWVVAVLGGALLTVVAELAGMTHATTVGMSAGIMGLLAAWSWLHPESTILLMFVFPVRGRWVLPLVVGVDFLMFAYGSDLALMAHLGGVVGAWLALRGWTRPRLIITRLKALRDRRSREKAKRRFRVVEGGRRDDLN